MVQKSKKSKIILKMLGEIGKNYAEKAMKIKRKKKKGSIYGKNNLSKWKRTINNTDISQKKKIALWMKLMKNSMKDKVA
jgi:hypothetical protein